MKIIANYLNQDEINQFKSWIESYKPNTKEIQNEHIKSINNEINGFSVLYNISNTEVSKVVSGYQGDNTIVENLPDIFVNLSDKIANDLNISKDHTFVQVIRVNAGGKVRTHYDAACPNYITYKCNINLDGPELDAVHVDKDVLEIKTGDLYCFEASLYKHWVEKLDKDRVLLSYGFMLPYADLGWDENSPRVRLSNRIWNHFQK